VTTFTSVVDAWYDDPEAAECIVGVHVVDARVATFGDLRRPLPPSIVAASRDHGIDRLFRHQAEAIDLVRERTHTVVVAGTAAGKSLTYRIPIVEAIEQDPQATALLLFPTKALGRDQLGGFGPFLSCGVTPAVYDGDTPADERRWVRSNANVVLTNPDMLHVGILPNHPNWARFLSGLRYVVLDEMHVLRGAFGTHAALILRRLRRLAARYGADPTFVSTSATIGNAGELASRLIGAPVTTVARDDAPRGERTFVVWNPELLDPDAGARASALADASRIFASLVDADVATILFARSRRGTELAYTWAAERLGPDTAATVAAYRGGYRADDRRTVERRLFSGELRGIVTTNALELGIDVGEFDASILATFPGTIASFHQQAGRAGRGDDPALTVLVCGADALDQYYATHPDELFSRPPEAAVVNPDNPVILGAHLRCAAHEADLSPDDRRWFGETFEERVTDLVAEGSLGIREGRVFSPTGRSPASSIDIRGSGGREYVIVDDAGTMLGTADEGRAFSQCHVGAVYLHQGDTYLVDVLDIAHREVRVRAAKVPWYTRAHVDKDLEILAEGSRKPLDRLTVHLGTVEVTTRVTGYQRLDLRTQAVLDTSPLDLPERSFVTDAIWFTFPPDVLDDAAVGPEALPGAIHAAEHTAIGVLPLFAVCDRWDVGGLSTPHHPTTGTTTFFIYDGVAGGTGIAQIAYARAAEHLNATTDILERCPCAAGCPSCVQSPKCGNENDPLDRFGALALLRTGMGRRA